MRRKLSSGILGRNCVVSDRFLISQLQFRFAARKSEPEHSKHGPAESRGAFDGHLRSTWHAAAFLTYGCFQPEGVMLQFGGVGGVGVKKRYLRAHEHLRPQSTGQALGFGHPTSATMSMFSCRMCSENPFNAMFGEQGKADKEKKKKDKRRTSKRNEGSFHPRTDDEVASAVSRWIRHAHPRANDFFTPQQQLHDVLKQLAKGIDREDDPILGGDEKCVYWYGDVTKEDLQAAIRMVKPGENAESVTYASPEAPAATMSLLRSCLVSCFAGCISCAFGLHKLRESVRKAVKDKQEKKDKVQIGKNASNETNADASPNASDEETSDDETSSTADEAATMHLDSQQEKSRDFQPRTDEEVASLVSEWMRYSGFHGRRRRVSVSAGGGLGQLAQSTNVYFFVTNFDGEHVIKAGIQFETCLEAEGFVIPAEQLSPCSMPVAVAAEEVVDENLNAAAASVNEATTVEEKATPVADVSPELPVQVEGNGPVDPLVNPTEGEDLGNLFGEELVALYTLETWAQKCRNTMTLAQRRVMKNRWKGSPRPKGCTMKKRSLSRAYHNWG
eukprot:s8_g62.t1